MSTVSLSRPLAERLARKVFTIVEVILHIGAQRSATTSFQAYLRCNSGPLSAQGIGFWGPHRTRRNGLFSDLVSALDGADGAAVDAAVEETRARIAGYLVRLKNRGKSHLIVSDENILGNARGNVRQRALYPDASARLAMFSQLFDGVATKVVLTIRATETYWPSAAAFSVGRGGRVPSVGALRAMSVQPRGWRDVIADVAGAFPGLRLDIDRHEHFAGRPERRLAHMLDGAVPPPQHHARLWLNRAPGLAELRAAQIRRGRDPARLPEGNGRWQPFTAAQRKKMHEQYEDDLFWLRAGADGLAGFIEEDRPDQAETNPPGGILTRGQDDDRQDGDLARAG